MIHYFIPYDIAGNLFNAYDYYASLVSNPEDWICFIDGDAAFLVSDWGHIIQRYVDKFQTMGMLTCYASRSGYPSSVPSIGNQENKDILFHKRIAEKLKSAYAKNCIIKPYNRRVSGHLMCIKKSIWTEIREDVRKRVEQNNKTILGVDTQISYSILATGKKIGLMKGLYLFHYFRFAEGRGNKKHLGE